MQNLQLPPRQDNYGSLFGH